MAAKCVGLDDQDQPRCGHSRAVGYADADGLWWCTLCGSGIDAAIDQEIAAAEEAAAQRKQP